MTVSRPATVVVLAAGAGTRMKSQVPKVLHPICGASMLDHVLAAARELSPAELIVVVGHRRREVIGHLAEHAPDARVVIQHRQGGTGHAVREVAEAVGLGQGTVVVTYGDTPLLSGQTLTALVREHDARQAAATVLTTLMDDPTGYGRILRDDRGAFLGIVEEADATEEQKMVTEINSGVYAFEAALLADCVKRLPTDNAKGEEYLTDVVGILRTEGHRVASVLLPDCNEVCGVNDRIQLAHAQRNPQCANTGRLDARRGDDRGSGDHVHRRWRGTRPGCRDRAGDAAQGQLRGRDGGAPGPGLPAAGHEGRAGCHRDARGLRVRRDRSGRDGTAVHLSPAREQAR